MSIITSILVILIMSCTIYLIYSGAKAVQDPNHPFSQLEFAVSSIALLCCSILVSYFAVVYIVVPEKPSITQSSQVQYNKG